MEENQQKPLEKMADSSPLPYSSRYRKSLEEDVGVITTQLPATATINHRTSSTAASACLFEKRKTAVIGRTGGRQVGCRIAPPYAFFFCPLSGGIMKDPVIISSNATYERSVIEKWFQDGHTTDPCLKTELPDKSLTPNSQLRLTIQEWEENCFVQRILDARDALASDEEDCVALALDDLTQLCDLSVLNRDWIRFEGLISPIVSCAKSGNLLKKVKCLSLLKSLVTDNIKNKEEVIDAGVLKVVVKSLLRQPELAQASIELLFELLKSNFIKSKLNQEKGMVLSLVILFKREVSFKEMISLILRQLSSSDESVKQMAAANYYTPLVDCLRYGLEESKCSMALFLAEWDLDDGQVDGLLTEGVVDPLLDMLQSRSTIMENLAIKVLNILSAFEVAIKSMSKQRVISVVVTIFCSEMALPDFKYATISMLKTIVLQCGGNFLVHECGISAMELGKFVHCLMSYLGNLSYRVSNTSLHNNILRILVGLASPEDDAQEEVRRMIWEEDGSALILSSLMKHRETELPGLVVELLISLSKGTAGAEWASCFFNEFQTSSGLLHDNDKCSLDVHVRALKVLTNVLQYDKKHINWSNEALLSNLVNMASLPNVEVKEDVVLVLLEGRFISPEHLTHQHFLVSKGLIPLLVDMLVVGTPPSVKAKAANALKNFSMNTHKLSLANRSRGSSVFLWQWGCRLHCGKCSTRETFCLLEAGAVPKLVGMLSDPDTGAANSAVDALATFFTDAKTVERGALLLHDLKAIDLLISLLTKSESCSKSSLDLLEKVFTVPKVKKIYWTKAKIHLSTLLGYPDSEVSQKAARMLIR